MQAEREDKRAKIAAYALAALCAIAPQLLGGVTPGTELAVLALSCVVCGLVSVSLRRHETLGRTPLAALGALLLGIWTLLQLIPVPAALGRALWPDRAQWLQELAKLSLSAAPPWCISVAPGATRPALALALTLTAVVMCSTAVARARQQTVLALGVALSSGLMACVALVHAVANADSVFGIYTPRHARPGMMLAPLINGNHLAGHIALGFPLSLCFALGAKRIDVRFVWFTLAFVELTAALFTLSRGGVAVMLLGSGLYAVSHIRGRRRRGRATGSRLAPVLASMGVVVCLTFVSYLAVDVLGREFRDSDNAFSKFSMFAEFFPLVQRYLWLGAGRGAFEDVSASVLAGNARAVYAENLPLQWLIEWGAPATVLAICLILVSFLTIRPRRKIEWALAAGLVAIVTQNLVDFSLELSGVAVASAVALGALLRSENPRNLKVGRLETYTRLPLRRLMVGSFLAALVTTVAAVPWLGSRSRQTLRAELELGLANAVGPLPDQLSVALTGYPVDPVFLILGAAHAVARNSPAAPAWLNLSMLAAPEWPGPHVQAAHWLEKKERLDQAALEVGLATERDLPIGQALACDFIKRHPSAALAASATATGRHEQTATESLAHCLIVVNRHDEAELLLADATVRFPGSLSIKQALVGTAIANGHVGLAVERARALRASSPTVPGSLASLIFALSLSGQADAALREYQRASVAERLDPGVLRAAAEAASRARDVTRLDQLVEDLLTGAGQTSEQLVRLHETASHWYARAEASPQALQHAQRAYELSGEPSLLERVHGLASSAGLAHVALRAAVEMCHLRHRGDMYCNRGSSTGGASER